MNDLNTSGSGKTMDSTLKRLIISTFFPGLFLLLIWLVFWVDISLDLELFYHGLFPRKWLGLQGILFAPIIHGSLRHIVANSFPILVLGTLLFYFYRSVAGRVWVISWLVSGILVWLFARPSYHIGASGLIYTFGGFLFLSGILRKHAGLIAISFLVVFQYGSMIWGIFPLEDRLSWEGHLAGLLVGLALSWIYRSQGPQGTRLFWQSYPDQDTAGEDEEANHLPWDQYEVEGKRKPPTNQDNAQAENKKD
ncbi:MAG: rhomboid family intramembrane serine protease [Bacteroidales bacterium]|jgi:membrane associated rhomboid family serine protease